MKRLLIKSAAMLFVIVSLTVSCSKTEPYNGPDFQKHDLQKTDFREGQGVDTNGNGKPDFVVRGGRFIGTVSGRDFGPATMENFNANRTTAPAQIKPATVEPARIKPSNVPASASAVNYTNYTNFRNYINYPIRQFLDATGWDLTSNRSHELPENIKNKIREIGDYLYGHYTYGTYKASDGIGQDDDHVFDCDDYAGLMYRMGREAGLEMYIIDLPGHWANAVRYGNTLYTVEPQGVKVKYRNTNKFGNLTVADYARYTEQIVVER
jgi:hypothetical protein